MTEPFGPAAAPNGNAVAGRIVVSLAGEHFALPIGAVEGVASPPRLARVPHAVPALLGAGQLGSRIVPIMALARLLGRERGSDGYDGGGEVLRLRVAGGSIGLWVDKVERVVGDAAELEAGDREGVQPIDPAVLLADCLDPPGLSAVAQAPLGEVGYPLTATPASTPAPAFIVVETGGRPVSLAREAVQELVQEVAWTPVPRAPEGLLGVGLLRGAALPLLSLAVLLGRHGGANSGGFVAVDVGGRRALLAVDRIIGLRFRSAEDDAAEPVDVVAVIPDELRRIVLGFSPEAPEAQPDDAMSREAGAYLAFSVAGLDCAVAAECVDRIVGPQPLIRLPRAAAGNGALEGAIELRGQILPVAALRAGLGLASGPEPKAYIIIRDAVGIGAIGVEQAKQLVRLHPSEIAPAPAGAPGAVVGVAARPDGGLLRIIAADRLWNLA